jgi:hypothetical protein
MNIIVGQVVVEVDVVVVELRVLLGVEDLEQRRRRGRRGSPTLILSISSSSTTGSTFSARFIACRILPGIAPMYVRRWPRISASSRTPPSADA